MADVFLSCARPDADTARRFADASQTSGFTVWWDDALRSGETFDETIERALRDAKAVVVRDRPLWTMPFGLKAGHMLRAIPLAFAVCLTTQAQTPPVGHQPGEEAAILAVMDAYMDEISANDLAAMEARQTPEGMTYRHRVRPDGGWDVLPRSNMDWVAPNMASDHTYRERYWSPTVLVRGVMAIVWAPYEFRIDGETSHCGVDVFSFSKIEGVWKVSNSMWTVEPNACDQLRPADPAMIRPRD